MAEDKRPVTRICDADADRIHIRGKDLCRELVGKLSFTEMLLLHLLKAPPTPMQTRILDAVLVVIMEHGLTPSAIAARLTFFGAPENLQGAVAAGLLGVGTRFAGPAGDCAELLAEIAAAPPAERDSVADRIVARCQDAGTPVPGFGHPIHKRRDPRVDRLVEVARAAGAAGAFIDAMYALGAAVNRARGKAVVVNVSAAIGAVLSEAGLPPAIMRGINLVARCAGLVGHLLEEMEEPASNFMWRLIESEVRYAADPNDDPEPPAEPGAGRAE